jgi:hypothetical protein
LVDKIATAISTMDERYRDEPRHQAGEQQRAADDLEAADEMGGQRRQRKAELGEATDALVGVGELEDAFPQENAARHQPQQQRRRRPVGRRVHEPFVRFAHCPSCDDNATPRRTFRGTKFAPPRSHRQWPLHAASCST